MNPAARAVSFLPVITLVTGLVAGLLTGGLSAPAYADDGRGGAARQVPGSLTGFGFDACAAPAQEVMDAWWESSPYAAVGIYIGGSNRQCQQPELDAGWVKTQLERGWHLTPLFVGPQASCSGYSDVMSSDLATAEQQGRAQAASAVATAKGLGIGPKNTLYYDLEDYDIAPDDCRRAALSFLSGWTDGLHGAHYESGVYSNVAAAITSLDYADWAAEGHYSMPDDIWFAWANGRADTVADSWVRSDEWDDHARIHQYRLDVPESYGGYALSIDVNWLDVGRGSVAPRARQLCKGVDVDLRRYPALAVGARGPVVEAAQCVLRRQRLLKGKISGRYDKPTVVAVKKAQKKLDQKVTGRLTRATWAALLARGTQPVLKVGSTGDPVSRLQRSLTAGLGRATKVDGVYSPRTARAVRSYQRKAGLPVTGVVTTDLWDRLSGRA